MIILKLNILYNQISILSNLITLSLKYSIKLRSVNLLNKKT